MEIEKLIYWITERYSILQKRRAGEKTPWTHDWILANYRFCNVHREDDAVTVWVRENWRNPFSEDDDLWYSMAVARLVNLPEVLAEIGYAPSPERVTEVLTSRKKRGLKMMNSAYMVSTNGLAMDKAVYIGERILAPIWKMRQTIRPRTGDTLEQFGARLMNYNGFAGFMTGQVIADTKYHGHLLQAKDWSTFALSGPGSRRGLNRVFNRYTDAAWKESDWKTHLLKLKTAVDPHLATKRIPEIHCQDLQNCLCEYDKYMRAMLGEGRPKQKYAA